jgi:hypothetical protein
MIQNQHWFQPWTQGPQLTLFLQILFWSCKNTTLGNCIIFTSALNISWCHCFGFQPNLHIWNIALYWFCTKQVNVLSDCPNPPVWCHLSIPLQYYVPFPRSGKGVNTLQYMCQRVYRTELTFVEFHQERSGFSIHLPSTAVPKRP